MKTILIEDEQAARRTLRGMLELYLPEVQILAEAESVQEGISAIKEWRPHLVFLDMELKGEKGLLVLEHFKTIDFEVIITTAYTQFALPSYDFGIADYLLKPLTPKLVKRGVERVLERYRMKQLSHQEFEKKHQELRLPHGRDEKRFLLMSIIRIEANRNYSWIHTEKEKPFLAAKNLAVLEELLPETTFIRVHHSHIVNLQHIERFNKAENQILLRDGQQLPVSRDRRKAVLQALE